jgi:hypothetical protein
MDIDREIDFERAYRIANPKFCPLSPHERQAELSDLWPSEQEKFKKNCKAALAAIEE